MSHQELESVFTEDVKWQDVPNRPPLRSAVLVSETDGTPLLIRFNVPAGVKVMPHRHSEDRIYTVISGVFYIGVGTEFNEDELVAYPPGSVIVLPGNTPHFHWARSGGYVSQIMAFGKLPLKNV
jgi:quercetin dioxygenase-like cupin family protein